MTHQRLTRPIEAADGAPAATGWREVTLPVADNPDGPRLAGRRRTSSGDAVLGPFQITPTGDTVEFRAVLPEGWR